MANKTQNKITSDMNANYRAISKPESNFFYVTNIGRKIWSIWKGAGCGISFGEEEEFAPVNKACVIFLSVYLQDSARVTIFF
jgi:hypothetical protein